MQVVVLCGGLGTRLKEITQKIPKPMVPFRGKPFLEYLLNLFRKQQFTNFLFLAGYLGDQIQDYFGSGEKWGVTIRYSQEAVPLGTGGALKQAAPLIEPEFLLVYGDSYLDISYRDLVQDFRNKQGLIELVIHRDISGQTEVAANVLWDEASRQIKGYQKNGGPSFTHIDAGAMAVSKAVFDLFPDCRFSLENEIFPLLIRDKQLLGYSVTERFYDIGTLERWPRFEKLIS